MCVLTVLLLIRQQIKYRGSLSSRGPGKNFKQQLTRLVNESPAVAGSLAVYEASERPAPQFERLDGDAKGEENAGWVSGNEAARDHESAIHEDDPYHQVRKLAGMGFEKEEIFKQVALPKGEIELILKLNSLNPGFKKA